MGKQVRQVPNPPPELDEVGAKLWTETLKVYRLAPHEVPTLVNLCLAHQYCTRLARQIASEENGGLLWADGRPNPAAVELRQQSIVYERLRAALALPEAGAPAVGYGKPPPNRTRGVRTIRPMTGGL
nr:Terminase [uncultured bacterium]